MSPRRARTDSTSETAGTRAVRVSLAREIARIVSDRGLTQCQAAELLGTTQPRVSALLAGKVDGVSLDRLVRFLNTLGEDIHIVVLPSAEPATEGVTRVMPAVRFATSVEGWSYA